MRTYHRLTREERYQIQALLQSGCSGRQCAKVLGRDPSTLSRELRRNRLRCGYRAAHAHRQWQERRQQIHPPFRIRGVLARRIRKLLHKQWSPEQIAGRLRQQGVVVSHECIYQFIYREQVAGGVCWRQLRRKRKRRRSRKAAKNLKNVGVRRNRNWIQERDKIVDDRLRLGDYERDTMRGIFKGDVLLVLTDRVSKYTRIRRLPWLNAQSIHLATVEALKDLPLYTITNDNGAEFDYHHKTAKALQIPIYFTRPYRPWERGTNENTIGLLRQYYPKGTDLEKVSHKEIRKIQVRLNNRPRKTLGYKTPLEVQQLLKSGVALST